MVESSRLFIFRSMRYLSRSHSIQRISVFILSIVLVFSIFIFELEAGYEKKIALIEKDVVATVNYEEKGALAKIKSLHEVKNLGKTERSFDYFFRVFGKYQREGDSLELKPGETKIIEKVFSKKLTGPGYSFSLNATLVGDENYRSSLCHRGEYRLALPNNSTVIDIDKEPDEKDDNEYLWSLKGVPYVSSFSTKIYWVKGDIDIELSKKPIKHDLHRGEWVLFADFIKNNDSRGYEVEIRDFYNAHLFVPINRSKYTKVTGAGSITWIYNDTLFLSSGEKEVILHVFKVKDTPINTDLSVRGFDFSIQRFGYYRTSNQVDLKISLSNEN